MKAEIILSKSWIQTSRKGCGNRFDEFLKFFGEGVGCIILCVFLGAVVFLSKILFFEQNFHEMGRRKAPRAHI